MQPWSSDRLHTAVVLERNDLCRIGRLQSESMLITSVGDCVSLVNGGITLMSVPSHFETDKNH